MSLYRVCDKADIRYVLSRRIGMCQNASCREMTGIVMASMLLMRTANVMAAPYILVLESHGECLLDGEFYCKGGSAHMDTT